MSLWLPQATSDAAEVDYLILALLLVSCAILALVFGLIWVYMIKYRAGSSIDRGVSAEKTWRLETAWTVATLLAFFGLFVWGADLYVRLFQPPPDALKIYVIGKQWMWKIEHHGGQREINAMHLPVGRPIQLVMTSEDVIHDFSVPAFRIKHDVLPGRYETLWFEVDRPGTYRLFCTQLCGTGHASMIGEVVAMSDPDYQKWLEQNGGGETMATAGKTLFMRFGCSGCHGGNGAGGRQSGSTVRAPALAGLYGSPVTLSDGGIVTADDRYIRDCILMPETQRVASYPPLMPSFAGQISEEDLLKIIAYI
ncbi:MAG: cytochrome c oxidase subunit II, partial [Methylocella sp.]